MQVRQLTCISFMKKFFLPLLLTGLSILPHGSYGQLANSLLWKISGNGLEHPSYLYGTMHVQDKRVFDYGDKVTESFDACEAYAMELLADSIDPMTMMEMMLIMDGSLEDYFTKKQYKKLDKYFEKELNMDLGTLSKFKPFFVYSMMLKDEFGGEMTEALDMHFYSKAKDAGMHLFGLETLDEQMAAVNSLTKEEQAEMIMDAIKPDKKNGESENDKMIRLYTAGKLDSLSIFSEEMEMGESFEAEFIDKRNHRMAERIEPLISKDATFIAVGALHLPGETGLISLLRQKGYTVEAVL